MRTVVTFASRSANWTNTSTRSPFGIRWMSSALYPSIKIYIYYLYLYLYLYMYIYIHIYIYIYVYIYISISMYMYMYISLHTYISISISIFLFIGAREELSPSRVNPRSANWTNTSMRSPFGIRWMSSALHPFTRIYMYMYMYMYIYMYIYLPIHLSISLSIYLSIYRSICIYRVNLTLSSEPGG